MSKTFSKALTMIVLTFALSQIIGTFLITTTMVIFPDISHIVMDTFFGRDTGLAGLVGFILLVSVVSLLLSIIIMYRLRHRF